MPTHRTTLFRTIVEQQLELRFNQLIEGIQLDEVSTKMLYFEHQDALLETYQHLKEPDIGRKEDPTTYYRYYLYIISNWCEKKIEEIKELLKKENKVFEELGYKNFDRDCIQHWTIFRRQMRITPTQRGFVSGYIEDGFLESKNTDLRYSGSIIIIGEAATLLSKIEEKLNEMNYPTSIISTTGTSASTVSEIIELLSTIEQDRKSGERITLFYLHDLDIDGYTNCLNLTNYTEIYSLGINSDFIALSKLDIEKLKEPYPLPKRKTKETKKNYEKRLSLVKKEIENKVRQLKNSNIGYLVEDLDSYRIDQEKVYVRYGLDPFINYFLKIIREKAIVWDLNRICTLEIPLPTRYLQLKERILNIWDKIEKQYAKDYNWVSCAEDKKLDFIDQNENFQGDITQLKQVIQQQKDEIQEIIDNNEENNKILDLMEKEIENIERKIY